MTAGQPGAHLAPACPYLGLVDDPETHFAFPSHAQRCYSAHRPAVIELSKQARDCLTAEYVTCSRYRAQTSPRTHGAPLPEAPGPLAPAPLTPVRPAAGRAGRVPRDPWLPGRRIVKAVLFVILLIAMAAGGLAVGGRLADQIRGGHPGPSASGPGGALPSSSASPATTVSQQPTHVPVATPAPTPTASAKATPGPIVHVVKAGETLSGIAQQYHVTVASIVAANSLKNASAITTGQKLIIPSPTPS